MKRSQKLMTFLGLVLGAFGIVLLNFGSAPTPSSAATDYTATWKATEILTVNGLVGNKDTGEAGIGVWEWVVTGKIGNTNYSETWSAPSIADVAFNVPPNKGCNLQNIIADQLMAGCWTSQDNVGGPDTLRYSFQIRGVSDLLGKKKDFNTGSGDQKTTSCIASPRNPNETECIFQSGSYSFQHVYELGSSARMRWLGGGTLTPLQWSVVGQID